MRTLLTAALILTALSPAPAFAQARTIAATSRIAEVTVYPDRAQVLRRASLSLQPGTYTVSFGPLPFGLQPDTVRVRGEGTARALVHGFELATAYIGQSPVKEVAALESKIRALGDQERAMKDQKAVHQRQLALLTATAEKTGEALAKQLAAGKAKLAEWRELMGFLKTQQMQEAQAIQGLDKRLRALDSDRKALRAELAKLQGFRAERVREVPVTVEVTRAGTLNLALEYVMPGASWHPAYDARLDAAGATLDWRYYGVVRQQTGEDWTDVALRLSTARPAAGSRPPAVPDWFLSLWQPQLERQARRKAAPAQAAPAPMAESLAKDEAEEAYGAAAEPVAVVTDQGTSVTLGVQRAVTIPSDGEPHQAAIGQATFKGESQYVAVPRLSPHAYLQVTTTNTGPWPLLPGPIKAFVGRDYVATSPLVEDVPPGAELELPMGVDRAVQVTRTRLAKQTGESGLLNKVHFAEYRFEVTVANHKPKAQQVLLVEPLPRATAEAVKVTLLEANHKPLAAGVPPGQAHWRFNLAPSEKKVLRWGYRVEYPQDAQLVGLE